MLLMAAMLSSELCIGGVDTPAAFNANIIAIDQDPAALMARCIYTNGGLTVWKKPLTSPRSDTFAAMFLNTDGTPASVTITNLAAFGTTNTQMYCLDLMSNVVTVVSNNWTISLPVRMACGFKLSPVHTGY